MPSSLAGACPIGPELHFPFEQSVQHKIPMIRFNSLAAYSYSECASDHSSKIAASKLKSDKHRPLEAPGKV